MLRIVEAVHWINGPIASGGSRVRLNQATAMATKPVSAASSGRYDTIYGSRLRSISPTTNQPLAQP